METTKSELTGMEHVWIRNTCWTLFNSVPLMSGNVNAASGFRSPSVFFRDDAQMDKVQKRMFDYAKSQHKTATDLVYHNYETVLLDMPLLGFTIPIPYVICYHEIQLSGVLQ